jgi:hypothetical protein
VNDLDLALGSIRAGSIGGYTVLLQMIDDALDSL